MRGSDAWRDVEQLLPPALSAPAQGEILLANVTVINPGSGRLGKQTIVISDGKIIAIRATLPTDPQGPCPGCYVMPGLIDVHVHTPPRIAAGNQELFALLYLAHGVKSVRDVGQSQASVKQLAAPLNSGAMLDPNFYRCGPMLDGTDPGWPTARQVLTPDEARQTVADLAADGVDCIKIYNHIDLPVFETIKAEAAARKIPVVGHVPHRVGLARAGASKASTSPGCLT